MINSTKKNNNKIKKKSIKNKSIKNKSRKSQEKRKYLKCTYNNIIEKKIDNKGNIKYIKHVKTKINKIYNTVELTLTRKHNFGTTIQKTITTTKNGFLSKPFFTFYRYNKPLYNNRIIQNKINNLAKKLENNLHNHFKEQTKYHFENTIYRGINIENKQKSDLYTNNLLNDFNFNVNNIIIAHIDKMKKNNKTYKNEKK